MNQYLRYLIPAYCIVYFLFLIVICTWRVGKQIGKNPVQLSFTDDLHGLVSKYFTCWMILLTAYSAIYCFYPSGYCYFMPMQYLENKSIEITGILILAVALIGTYVAQGNMRQSWRIGIDEQQKTDLITTGIFGYSRNPVYVGMLASMIGLFMVTPNGFTLMLLVVGYLLIEVQVRVEEEFLLRVHGQSYADYKTSVRRFI